MKCANILKVCFLRLNKNLYRIYSLEKMNTYAQMYSHIIQTVHLLNDIVQIEQTPINTYT